MRALLPSSVLSSLLSHIAHNSHPVKSLHPPRPFVLPRQRSRERGASQPSPPDALWSSELGDLGQSGETASSEPQTWHLAGSGARRVYGDTLTGALAFIDKYPLPPSPTSTDLINRQRVYTRFVTSFLSDSSDAALNIIPLIDRSLAEGVPLSVSSLTQIFHASLQGDHAYRTDIVRKVLPLLPERLDITLLITVLRVAIRDMRPEPDVVQQIITDCLKLEGVHDMEGWPWRLWDVVITAHRALGDYPGALRQLGAFTAVAKREIARRVQEDPDLNETEVLDANERDAVDKAYATTMNIWREQYVQKNRRRREREDLLLPEEDQPMEISPETRAPEDYQIGSAVPWHLAQDLGSMVGESMGVHFLAAWLKAERVVHNWDMVEELCGLMSKRMDERVEEVRRLEAKGKPSPEVDYETREAYYMRLRDLVPISKTYWSCFFSLYRSPLVKTLPPLRASVARLLDQPTTTVDPRGPMRAPQIDSHTIITILLAIFRPLDMACWDASTTAAEQVDLPLALVVMDLVGSRRCPAPLDFYRGERSLSADNRLVNILFSGIYRTVTRGLPSRVHDEVGMTLSVAAGSDGPARVGYGDLQFRLSKMEWDRVMQAVDRVRMEEEMGARKADGDRQGSGRRGRPPLLQPIALPLTGETSAYGPGRPSSTANTLDTQEAGLAFAEERRAGAWKLHRLIAVQKILLEKAVVAFTMHHRRKEAWRRAAVGEVDGEEKLPDSFESVLSATVGKVTAELMPPLQRQVVLARWEAAEAQAAANAREHEHSVVGSGTQSENTMAEGRRPRVRWLGLRRDEK